MVIRSKITKKLLNYFFLNEDERFYINEIAKIIKEDPKNVHTKLIELKEQGILDDEFQGNQRYFFINKNYPLLKEYRNIVLKKIGFEKILKERLEKIKGIDSIYIFGSYADNKLSPESDIDLLIIGDFDTLELQKHLLEIQRLSGREINSVELAKKEFDKKMKEKDFFLGNIFSKKYIKII